MKVGAIRISHPDPKAFEDPENQELLAQLNALLEANPLQGYFPLAHQKEFHAAQTNIKALIAGTRAGKSHSSIADDLIQAVDEECLPDHLKPYKRWQPPFKCWICCPKFEKLEDTILPKLRQLSPKAQLLGGSFDNAYNKQLHVLKFANGSQFGFKTYDQDRDSYAGADLMRIHWDEEPEGQHGWEIRQEGRARLIDHGGDEVLSMTPLLGYSWVYDAIWEHRTDSNITVVRASMDDNPHLDEISKQQYLDGLSEDEIKARRYGEFVHFAGEFYSEFSSKHIVDPLEKESIKGQDVVVGIDPGKQTGVIWLGFDNDNIAIAFAELYPNDRLVPDIATEIKAMNDLWGVEPRYVIDPSSRNRVGPMAEQFEAAFAQEGIYCEYGQNARGPGILEVKRRLQNEGLLVSNACQKLIWEFGRYRRNPNSQDEWEAIKENDHLLDALRYAVMSRTWHVAEVSHTKRPAYQQNFQPPYGQENFASEPPPLGILS